MINRELSLLGIFWKAPQENDWILLSWLQPRNLSKFVPIYSYFWNNLEKHFGLKSMPFESEISLINYKKGKIRISEFNVRFKQLASAADFYESALCSLFIANLNTEILNFLIRIPPIPFTLAVLMELCAHLDSSFLGNRYTSAELPTSM